METITLPNDRFDDFDRFDSDQDADLLTDEEMDRIREAVEAAWREEGPDKCPESSIKTC